MEEVIDFALRGESHSETPNLPDWIRRQAWPASKQVFTLHWCSGCREPRNLLPKIIGFVCGRVWTHTGWRAWASPVCKLRRCGLSGWSEEVVCFLCRISTSKPKEGTQWKEVPFICVGLCDILMDIRGRARREKCTRHHASSKLPKTLTKPPWPALRAPPCRSVKNKNILLYFFSNPKLRHHGPPTTKLMLYILNLCIEYLTLVEIWGPLGFSL